MNELLTHNHDLKKPVVTGRSLTRNPDSALPLVSVVIPCLNEERFIGIVLENLVSQYEHELFEIIVADGMSSDGTRQIIEDFGKRYPRVSIRVIDNPARIIPVAVNLGIREARGEIILRIDAHSVPSENYVRRCVELLSEGQAAVVGMPWHIKPGADSLVGRAIALAVAHPFGIGDARYRLANSSAQFVDTVPFGAFKKTLWEELGGFNESLLANEDYDFNYRVRRRGGQVLLDNAAHSDYFARPTLRSLAIQYFRYGKWKALMLKLHPQSIRWRHTMAPLFTGSIVLLGLAGMVWSLAWLTLGLELSVYFTLAVVLGRQRGHDLSGGLLLTLLMPVVFLIIHLSWGTGFLVGLARALFSRKAASS